VRRNAAPPLPLVQSMGHTECAARCVCQNLDHNPAACFHVVRELTACENALPCAVPSPSPFTVTGQTAVHQVWGMPRSLHWFRTFLHIGNFQCACASQFLLYFFHFYYAVIWIMYHHVNYLKKNIEYYLLLIYQIPTPIYQFFNAVSCGVRKLTRRGL
jgi:hypothetical protein